MLKGRRGDVLGCAIPSRPIEEFLARLPFPLTGAQRRGMEEISRDMASGRPMNRLVQGDVGSGKTVVAAYAAWLAAGAGYLSFACYVRTAKREFGGTTGDLSGWFLQLCELSSLAGLVLAQRLEVLL